MGQLGGSFVIVLLILIVLFLLAREAMCWYWKINIMVGLLEDIKTMLGGRQTGESTHSPTLKTFHVAPLPTSPSVVKIKCPGCGQDTSADGNFCESCGLSLK